MIRTSTSTDNYPLAPKCKWIAVLFTSLFFLSLATQSFALTLLFEKNNYDKDVWLTIQDPFFSDPARCFNGTYGGGTQIDFTDSGSNVLMSVPLKLSEIGTAGIDINYAYSAVLYLYFDDPTGENRSAAPAYNVSDKRFQPFEITMTGSDSDSGDMTAINYFTAPIGISSNQYNPLTNATANSNPLQKVGYSLTGSQIARNLKQASGGNASSYMTNSSGAFVRYMGPSSFTSSDNPWPSFIPYLKDVSQDSQVTRIYNSNQFNFPGDTAYVFGFDMNATADSQGNISLEGNILVSKTGPVVSPNPAIPDGEKWTDASLTFSVADPNAYNNAIYGQVNSTALNFSGTAWEKFKAFTLATHQVAGDNSSYSLNNLPGSSPAFSTTVHLLIGDITTGLIYGFVNSNTLVNGTTAIKDMASKNWWTIDPANGFSIAQPDNSHTYYSPYSEVIAQASNNTVYSAPYSDRFTNAYTNVSPAIMSVSYTPTGSSTATPVNFWKITVGAPADQTICLMPRLVPVLSTQ